MVSEHYAKSKALEPKSFRKLLFQLGITDCIQAPKQTVSLSQVDKPTSPWGSVNLGDAAEGGWVIQDHSAQEFEAIVQSLAAAEDQAQALPSMQYLAEMLSAHWAAHLGHWLSATCVNKSTGEVHAVCSATPGNDSAGLLTVLGTVCHSYFMLFILSIRYVQNVTRKTSALQQLFDMFHMLQYVCIY